MEEKAVANVVKFDFKAKVAEFHAKTAGFAGLAVDLGIPLKITKKGQLQNKNNEKQLWDSIECVLVSSKPFYNLWGKEGTPDADKLLFQVNSMEEAVNTYEEMSAEDPVFGQLYSKKDIQERLLITFVGSDENIYSLDLTRVGKGDFSKYVAGIFQTHGVGPTEVLTSIDTVEKTSGKNSWIAPRFNFVKKLEV